MPLLWRETATFLNPPKTSPLSPPALLCRAMKSSSLFVAQLLRAAGYQRYNQANPPSRFLNVISLCVASAFGSDIFVDSFAWFVSWTRYDVRQEHIFGQHIASRGIHGNKSKVNIIAAASCYRSLSNLTNDQFWYPWYLRQFVCIGIFLPNLFDRILFWHILLWWWRHCQWIHLRLNIMDQM